MNRHGPSAFLYALLVVLCARGVVLAQELSSRGEDYYMPLGALKPYSPVEVGVAPAAVEDFWLAEGGWDVVWNYELETPYWLKAYVPEIFAAPEMFSPEVDTTALLGVARDFVDRHAEFFGVAGAELGEPYVYPVAESWVILLRQFSAGGLPVRGANVRFFVDFEGRLSWVKAYLVRQPADVPFDAVDESAAALALPADATILRSEAQLGFPVAGEPMALWSVQVEEAGGLQAEYLIDPAAGQVVARHPAIAHWDGDGAAAGAGIATGSAFGTLVNPENPLEVLSTALPGVVIREGKRVVAATDRGGTFEAEVSLRDSVTLSMSLDHISCMPDSTSFECFPLQAVDEEGEHYTERLRVRPVLSSWEPGELEAGDADNNNVPDLVQTRAIDEIYRFDYNGFSQPDGTDVEKSLWLSNYLAGYFAYDFIERGLRRAWLQQAPYYPTHCLVMAPIRTENAPAMPMYTRTPFLEGCNTVLAGSSFALRHGAEPEPADWSVLAHEAAHHILFALTNDILMQFGAVQFKEGIVDALAGKAKGDPEFGRVFGEGRTDAFTLNRTDDSFRPLVRKTVGNVLYRVQTEILEPGVDAFEPAQPYPSLGSTILFHWLVGHHSPEGVPVFTTAHDVNLYGELLEASDRPELGGDGDFSNGTPYRDRLFRIFRDSRLATASFRRGDATLDGQLNLGDALVILDFLFFQADGNRCFNAFDADNSGRLDVADPVTLLRTLFFEADAVPEPKTCGFDLEAPGLPGNLGCFESACAPMDFALPEERRRIGG